MLYTLILYVCASATPCKVEEAQAMVVSRDLAIEECANTIPGVATTLAAGKFFVARCRLDPTQHKG